ncbi:MAG: HAMP domain-containing histidine kinase [Ruminococcus sp.]|uniref:sensor histidine kinase n=1 Tax=Ruminococcus sp. TaxID=41978 RepID=UPI0025ECC6EF|nr:HAMP domain-containing sensor histidine kinase [Ruminococcus sp.]MCR5600854.1 HAMP domain-containing histidine kinase [Ruminococcus sp.]
MSRFVKTVLSIAAVFAVLITGLNYWCRELSERRIGERNVTTNRINDELVREHNTTADDIDVIIARNISSWRSEYGSNAPERIEYIPLKMKSEDAFYVSTDKLSAVCSIYDNNGELEGFVEYTYKVDIDMGFVTAANTVIIVCFIIILAAVMYIYFAVLAPFRKLSEYPERLARLRDIQKLPESRNRYFGKYIWGMNMLTDVLKASSRRIHDLEGQRQKFVSAIAHGVKTPVANIRLYTDAVRTGLYSDKGMTADITDKIDHNAEKIEALAADLIASSNASADGCDIEVSRFPISELAELIRREYKDRMKLKMIGFSVECSGEAVVESDKYALYRAVSQLLENAVKYGDGSSIAVRIMRDDEGFCITVRNSGKLLPENELPYVFRSYWRGSNASDKNGSGIGLYVVHETAKALGGSAYVRRLEETSEMEFTIYIENA